MLIPCTIINVPSSRTKPSFYKGVRSPDDFPSVMHNNPPTSLRLACNANNSYVIVKTQPEKELCECRGNEPQCPLCYGTGVVDRPSMPIEGKWHLNIHRPEGQHWCDCFPTSHVICANCRRRIVRRKIWDHLQREHNITKRST